MAGIRNVGVDTNGVQNVYDPLGSRKQKTVGAESNMPVTTQFVLAGGQEIADYNGTGVGTAWMLTVRGAGGLPVASVTSSASGLATVAAYYHHDVMGSTVAATGHSYAQYEVICKNQHQVVSS